MSNVLFTGEVTSIEHNRKLVRTKGKVIHH